MAERHDGGAYAPAPLNARNIGLALFVKGRRITEYPHEGDVFVEGREGSEYEIEVTNFLFERVEAIISVDGLSVIDGEAAGPQSRGYIIAPSGVLRVPGWRLDAGQAARFVFGSTATSYASQMTGSAANNGVIGVMAFRAAPPPPSAIIRDWRVAHDEARRTASSPTIWPPGDPVISPMGGVLRSISVTHTHADTSQTVAASASLGTGFGRAEHFATHEVPWKRGEMYALRSIYYDDAKGLRRRGITLRPEAPPKPNAFPGMATGCTPPPGWRGD